MLGNEYHRTVPVRWSGGGADVGLGFEEATLLINVYSTIDLACAPRLFTTSISTVSTIRRTGGVANAMASTVKPIVNTGMLRGKAAGNIVASVSNGFALGIRPKTAVIISFVNCRPRRVIMNGRADFGVRLGRSARLLSRMIMINCNMRGGGLIANTAIRMGNRSVTGLGAARTLNTLRDRSPNMGVRTISNRPNSKFGVGVHNTNAGKGATPICIVSNMTNNSVGTLGPTSVRHVSILGSTTSYTVCNSDNTGNIVLVAAGRNGMKGISMSCSKGVN